MQGWTGTFIRRAGGENVNMNMMNVDVDACSVIR